MMKDSFVQQKKTKLSSTEKKTEKKKKNCACCFVRRLPDLGSLLFFVLGSSLLSCDYFWVYLYNPLEEDEVIQLLVACVYLPFTAGLE